MHTAMATTRKPRATTAPRQPRSTGSRSSKAAKPEAAGRKESVFTRVGNEAKAEAQRKLLLRTLADHDWSLKATAEALEMGALASVIRALKELAPDEYEAAQSDGRIKPGKRAE